MAGAGKREVDGGRGGVRDAVFEPVLCCLLRALAAIWKGLCPNHCASFSWCGIGLCLCVSVCECVVIFCYFEKSRPDQLVVNKKVMNFYHLFTFTNGLDSQFFPIPVLNVCYRLYDIREFAFLLFSYQF